jgi:3'(2'), 5'-bisphosphate nucleotidase
VAATAEDHRLAYRLAERVGEVLVDLRARLVAERAEQRRFRVEGDRAGHEELMRGLAEAVPGDAVLSEEGKDDPARLESPRTWIVDPLDGTREFSEPPRSDWAIHVALVIDGETSAGAVSLPGQGLVFGTDPPAPIAPRLSDGPPRIVVSRTRPPPAASTIARALGGELVAMGSAGAKAMAVVLGHADVYAHSGGQYEWDNCAPVAVAAAAGLHVSRIDGSPLVYNNPSVYLPDFLICRPELADDCLDALRGAISRSRLWTPHDDDW